MAAKRHMNIKRNITGHNIIIADITGYSLIKLCVRRMAVALRAQELYSTIVDIHHLEIKILCLKLMA